jgi:hypothetical protein
MAIDPSRFHLFNVTDTCAIWNTLSSGVLYGTARAAGCHFCCTAFVYYECLHKARKEITKEDVELQRRLTVEIENGNIRKCDLDIADLQMASVLENRKKVSKGELSSIVFAAKANLAFLTDDQKARRLAETVAQLRFVQTTPQLFGWLYFTAQLSDGDKDSIVSEHLAFGRPLKPHFEAMYFEALRCRALANIPPS